MVGDAKLVLRQLCDAARANDWKRAGQSDWLQEVAEVRTNFDRVIIEQEHKHHDGIPIHPARVARELCEVIDPRTCLSASRWASRRRECQPLQIQVTLSVIGRGKVKGCLQIAVSIRGLGRTSTLVADCRLLNHTPIVQPLPTSYPLRRDPHRIGLQLEDEVLNCWFTAPAHKRAHLPVRVTKRRPGVLRRRDPEKPRLAFLKLLHPA
jgi:hypothetical protein